MRSNTKVDERTCGGGAATGDKEARWKVVTSDGDSCSESSSVFGNALSSSSASIELLCVTSESHHALTTESPLPFRVRPRSFGRH